ncbi:MAG: hypothetical protein Q9208_007489 [Pyrenodesmia sp. 3 TL-2023]
MPQLEDANRSLGIRDVVLHTPATPHIYRRELANLPVDVLNCIFDLFYNLAAPHLYRHIRWGVSSSPHHKSLNKKLLNMLDRDNRGLDHLRRLELMDFDEFSKVPDTEDEYPDVELFAHFLPKDILQSFQWDSWHPLPSRVYRTLLSRQRSLTELELNHTELALDELYGYGPTSLLINEMPLKRLRIMPGPGEALSQAACELFEAHPQISHLTLDLYHLRKDDEVGWDDLSTANGALLRKLFRTVEPSSSRLRILELNSVDLHGSHDTIGSAINPKCLKELIIANCPNAEKFLMAANKKLEERGPLGLTRFVLYHARVWQPPNHAAGADDNMESMGLVKELSTFLASTTISLRELWVGLRGYDELPNVSSIISHGPTLEWLFLDIRVLKAAPAATYSFRQWQELCDSLKVVRQVDTAYPSVAADCHLENYGEFCEFVTATANIPTLSALGVNDWPYPAGTDFNDPRAYYFRTDRNNKAYCELLAALATDIVGLQDFSRPKSSTLTPSTTLTSTKDLAIITFGMFEKLKYERNTGYDLDPAFFVKSQFQLWTGEHRRKMEPVDLWAVTTLGCYKWRFHLLDTFGRNVGKYEDGVEDGW